MSRVNEVNSFFSMENLFDANPYLASLTINDYPIIMIFWNLFLLAVPFFLFILLSNYYLKNKFKKLYQKIIAFCLFILWFLFIPNTVYVVTDIRHLLDYCPVNYFRICVSNAWMIMFFFVYACLGWIFFVFFLNQMRGFLTRLFSKEAGKIFIILIIPLVSMGVLLGLLDRFNSWDVFSSPLVILKTMLMYITNFYYLRNFLAFTAGLYILYFIGSFLFKDKFKK